MKSGFSPVPLIIFGVGAVLLVWLIMSSLSVPKPAPGTIEPVAAATPTNEPVSAASVAGLAPDAAAKELSESARLKLLGNWQRTDAEYQINIRNVRVDGGADAEYLNPRSINVSRANVVEAESEVGFFMELQDVGYPGSTYTLRYQAQEDQLVGVYYQAAMQESYEVSFARMR